ncbi:MAG: ATP-binding protein [Melioribacteraceae bacterium]|nr:ATP-binding protein [Melioribacteraceae bacterium]
MTTKKSNKKLVVKSTTENLSLVRDFVKETTSAAGLSEVDVRKVTLAVDEACTNIIKHAYKYSPNGNITIHITVDNEKISVKIVDDGGHFNPNLVPEPDLLKLQKERKGGGLGMFLMKKLMDSVTYTNLTGNRNQVVLVKFRS